MVGLMSKSFQNVPSDHRQRLGRWGENLAADFLEAKGYRILDRNWRSRNGEIDLITQMGETIAFVEVKTRKGRDFGLPEEGLTSNKAKRLQNLAQQYLAQNELHEIDWRIDLVAVELDQNGRLLRCEHIPNAVLGW
jgi:putative endonuclease